MNANRPGGVFLIEICLVASALAFGAEGAAAQPVPSGGNDAFLEGAQVSDPIFEQYRECSGGGAASQQFPDYGDAVLQSADDFSVSGTWYLSHFVAVGSFSTTGPMGPVTFLVYDSDGPGGLPGTLLCSEVGIDSVALGPVIDLVLDQTCALNTGTYWVSVMPVMSFTDLGQWFWGSNETGFGSEFAFRDPDDLIGNPCVDWGLGISDCGVNSNYPNLCFGIGAVEGCGTGGG